MQKSELYDALPDNENFVGNGRFGWVKKVRRKTDSKVSNHQDSVVGQESSREQLATFGFHPANSITALIHLTDLGM